MITTTTLPTTMHTDLGLVTITDVRMQRSNGYGQYSIIIDIEFEGSKEQIVQHSTDSQLFDLVYGEPNHTELLLSKAIYIVERSIINYINSL